MDDYLKELNKEKMQLEKEKTELEKEINRLSTDNSSSEKEPDNSDITPFPKDTYRPSTATFLFDEFKAKNGTAYRSFVDDNVKMKGDIYNNGIVLLYDGQVTFYLENKCKLLEFVLGPVDGSATKEIMTLKIYVDGKQMDKVINRSYEDNCQTYRFDISDCNELKIKWANCGGGLYATADMKVYK